MITENMTFPERKMAEILDNANISYSYQVPLVNGFILDFVIDNTNICIEVDGEFWHRNRKKYDKMRDRINNKSYYNRNGYKTLRFPASIVCDWPDFCLSEIKNELINYNHVSYNEFA